MTEYDLREGDCLAILPTIADNSIDSVVTDPPYELGFMGKGWDSTGIANNPALWSEVLRVLRPGGHCVAFSSTRTYHRMACAIEDAGFEVRDQIQWVYSQGFPKSHNVSRNLDDDRCLCGETTERGVRLMPDTDVSTTIDSGEERGEALLSSVSQQSASTHGQEDSPGVNDWADESGMEGRGYLSQETRQLREREICSLSSRTSCDGESGRLCDGASLSDGEVGLSTADANGMRSPQGPSTAEQSEIELRALAGQSQPQKRRAWDHCERCGKPIIPDGLGTALKPANEPICLSRKPLSEKTVAANVLRWGTGAINVDGCRIEATDKTPAPVGQYGGSSIGPNGHKGERNGSQDHLGRFPANFCHDGSQEVLDLFPETKSGSRKAGDYNVFAGNGIFTKDGRIGPMDALEGSSGSAARFFYCAKASKADRAGSKHPTVKPVKLMQWLCRMVTPPGGSVLDPFAGSGTTGAAAIRESFRPILIEREPEYIADIKHRLSVHGGRDVTNYELDILCGAGAL